MEETILMPQPLSKLKPDASIMICNAGDRPLRHNPRLGLLAMEVIISWSNVESFLMGTYLELFGGPKDLAADIYLGFDTKNAKTSAINTAARQKLSGDRLKVFNAVIAIAKTSQRNRDKLAHWTWGYSPNLPDAFILTDPKNLIHRELDRNLLFVYKDKDFIDMFELNDKICSWGHSLKDLIQGGPGSDKVFDQLCKIPEIQEKVRPQG